MSLREVYAAMQARTRETYSLRQPAEARRGR